MASPVGRRLLLALVLSIASGEVLADTSVAVYADGDNDAATGCAATFPGGTFSGAETRVTVSLSLGAIPAVAQVTRSNCASGVFGAPVTLSGAGPIGSNIGTGGAEVIEFSASESAVFAGSSTVARLGFAGVSDASSDVCLTQNGTGGGSPILIIRSAAPIPTLNIEGALLLMLLIALAGSRAARLHHSLAAAVCLVLGAGVAWAAGFVVDGLIGDWSGEPVRATDAAGGPPAADLRAAYFGIEGGVVFFRVDVGDLQNQAPTVNPQSVATNEDQALVIVLTGNDPEGQPITFAIASLPVGGSLGPLTPINATQASVLYTPGPNWNGSDGFGVTASDGLLTGPATAIGVMVNPVNDAPTATPKLHQTHSGIRVTIGVGASGLLKEGASDPDDPPADLSVSATFGAITPPGATITLTNPATGAFQYDPPPGYSGAASFTFQVCDDGAPAAPVLCSPPTQVTFQITGPDLWFVDDSGSPAGTGRLSGPFDALSDLPPGRGAGDRIFVFSGAYATGHTLLGSEQLIGQGASGTFDGLLGVVTPPNGALDPRPSLGGARPQAGGSVAVAGGSVLRGLDVSTNGAVGLSGGAVSGVTVSEASVTSTGASAVSLNGTGGTFSLTSVSAGSAPSGIALNGTTGSFTVTGSGTPGSGGTIQNTTGRGASFISASQINLANMNFTNAGTSDLDATNGFLSTGDNLDTNAAIHLVTVTNVSLDNINISGGAEQGINGNDVTNFALLNSSIANVGNAADEDGIHFFNMLGSSRIASTTISGNFYNGLNLQMQSGDLDLNIIGGSVSGEVQGSGYLFGIRGTAIANLSFEGASSTNNFSGGIAADAFDNSIMNLRVLDSTSSGNNDQLSVSAGDNSQVDFEATGNTLSSVAVGDFVVVSLLGSAFDSGYVFDARIHDNTVSVANGLNADGIFVFNAGGGIMNTAITNNTITYAATQRGIVIQQGQDGPATTRATVTGNAMDIQIDGVGNATNGILAQSGVADPSGAGSFLDLNLGGAGALANTFTHSLGGVLPGGDIRVRQRFSNNVNLDGYAGGQLDTAAVVAYLNGRNNEVSPSTATITTGFFSGSASPFFITVTVSAASVAENGATNLVYTFTRNGSTAASLVANFAITGSTDSSDFSVIGATTYTAGTGIGTVTFSAGSATTQITVDPTADGTAELDESVVVDAGNSSTANGSFARALISNDD